MLDLVLLKQQPKTTDNFRFRSQLQWTIWYLGIIIVAGLIALSMYWNPPDFSWIAWLLLILSIALTIYQPRFGIYLTVFWTLAGDQILMFWYPFAKNFSSSESLLYVNDKIIFSPLELMLVLTLVSWLVRDAMHRKLRLYRGVLFWPTMLFGAFVVFGLIYGIVRGGNINIALWETRVIFYMLLMVVLISNLFEKKDHIKTAIGFVVIALFVKALYGTFQLLFVLKGDLSSVETLTEHQAAIHLSTIVVLAGAVWLFRVGWRKQLVLYCILPPILLTIVAAQRRAAFVALLIAFILIAVVLFRERRKTFWLIVPPAAVFGLAYLGVFWNSGSPLAGPAQAVKSVIAEDQANIKDRASNDYRKIENFNSTFTIKQEPLTGVGFGNKFYIVIPMPDISFFAWWEYVPHNSVIYIWIKSGIGGFLALLLFVGLTITYGVRSTVRLTNPLMRAIALTATLHVIMHFIYAYVDISWEAQGMVMLGLMVGILNSIEPIVAVDRDRPKRRWPWQKKPQQISPLLPLPTD